MRVEFDELIRELTHSSATTWAALQAVVANGEFFTTPRTMPFVHRVEWGRFRLTFLSQENLGQSAL